VYLFRRLDYHIAFGDELFAAHIDFLEFNAQLGQFPRPCRSARVSMIDVSDFHLVVLVLLVAIGAGAVLAVSGLELGHLGRVLLPQLLQSPSALRPFALRRARALDVGARRRDQRVRPRSNLIGGAMCGGRRERGASRSSHVRPPSKEGVGVGSGSGGSGCGTRRGRLGGRRRKGGVRSVTVLDKESERQANVAAAVRGRSSDGSVRQWRRGGGGRRVL
jgi:hypothetical protein